MKLKLLAFVTLLLGACGAAPELPELVTPTAEPIDPVTQEALESAFMDLPMATSAEEEAELLQEIMTLIDGSDLHMTVSAEDAQGSEVVQDLGSGVLPIVVTTHVYDGHEWQFLSVFTPIEIENAYILLNE